MTEAVSRKTDPALSLVVLANDDHVAVRGALEDVAAALVACCKELL